MAVAGVLMAILANLRRRRMHRIGGRARKGCLASWVGDVVRLVRLRTGGAGGGRVSVGHRADLALKQLREALLRDEFGGGGIVRGGWRDEAVSIQRGSFSLAGQMVILVLPELPELEQEWGQPGVQVVDSPRVP